jgi:hypothetical protein
MMGGGAAYHFARLICSAPRSLPGRIVNVTLGDMGMTRMMGGTAPLGAHMMLRVAPASIPAGQISLVVSKWAHSVPLQSALLCHVAQPAHRVEILNGVEPGSYLPRPD